MIELSTVYMGIGFLLAAYSVIANDSVQTLGTFMSSNSKVRWQYLWIAASILLVGTLGYSWYMYNGDISFGRLTKIPYQEVQWYHALAPGLLLILTRFGVPVSTSFLVLSAFASSLVLEKMLLKSVIGYIIAAIFAYALWFIVARFLDESKKVREEANNTWKVAQWCSTGLLWFMWLSHDMANIAVFLPRELSVLHLCIVLFVFVSLLAVMFYERGGKIQSIVKQKTSTKFIRSATIVDLAYAFILWYFKELNNIPMSTTWVFVGLLAGREFAIATVTNKKMKNVFPMVRRDFAKMTIGLLASIGIAVSVHYL